MVKVHCIMVSLKLAFGCFSNLKKDYLKASLCGRNNIVEILLKNKANVNLRNKFGQTALHIGISYLKVSCIKLYVLFLFLFKNSFKQ